MRGSQEEETGAWLSEEKEPDVGRPGSRRSPAQRKSLAKDGCGCAHLSREGGQRRRPPWRAPWPEAGAPSQAGTVLPVTIRRQRLQSEQGCSRGHGAKAGGDFLRTHRQPQQTRWGARWGPRQGGRSQRGDRGRLAVHPATLDTALRSQGTAQHTRSTTRPRPSSSPASWGLLALQSKVSDAAGLTSRQGGHPAPQSIKPFTFRAPRESDQAEAGRRPWPPVRAKVWPGAFSSQSLIRCVPRSSRSHHRWTRETQAPAPVGSCIST